jgi:hypothetical protein
MGLPRDMQSAVMMQVWLYGPKMFFSYCQLAKQTWTVEFTIDIFTGMGPLLGWALGLCTYRTPLEPALCIRHMGFV